MRVRPFVFAALVGCGNAPADVDGGARDATVDAVGDVCEGFACSDVFAQSDGFVAPFACPDAGYFVTVDGDGLAKVLSSSFDGVPVAQFTDCCGVAAFSVIGSESPDAGPSLRLQQASAESADGGLTFHAGSPDIYFRADGTAFSSSFVPDASPAITYTQLGAPGGFVAGTYAISVATSSQPDAASLSLSGTFLACRLPDGVCGCPPPPGP